ncbi:D-amino acid dehydrogenase small subunit [Magnetospirillum sp. XM-1]|uniref:D-amino acid dehydrogenase n=1 Tax=Magnetospirillum sp. XM-1 TaxID=1663591 RepID=UPI00073DE40C|nr:D-amino acid dehydrogenase [Magnetospirillum sp. XM-1]CUW40707.1 D-amino acid dehydrogenase small subunit [Magnetospirillum sp. XM-1]
MKVVVIGAGVIGTASAWYLARAGHDVTVVDRREGAGLETSFANGGQVSPCHAEPWANPSVLPKVLKWLGREDAPLLFRWNRWDPALWAWGLRFLANCPRSQAEINTERTLRVALYSRACLGELRAETGIDYDQQTRGILHVYRDGAEFEHACRAAEVMIRHGLRRMPKNADECVGIEPALAAVRGELAGGIYTPDDESGDAHKFTRRLAELAAARGVEFRWNVPIQGLLRDGGRVSGLAAGAETIAGDAYVLAAGCDSPLLARPLGLKLPVIPAKGYSVTVPVANHAGAPFVSVTDDEHKMVYSRLGDRLRAAGTAEMAGYDRSLNPLRSRLILENTRRLFPDGGDFDRAEPWAGLRPVTPDSVPLLGATPFSNLWLNTGHGTLGWTMSCGSGRVIADLVSGQQPDIGMDGLGVARFASYL